MAILPAHQQKTLASHVAVCGGVFFVCMCVWVLFVATAGVRASESWYAYLESFVGCVREDAGGEDVQIPFPNPWHLKDARSGGRAVWSEWMRTMQRQATAAAATRAQWKHLA